MSGKEMTFEKKANAKNGILRVVFVLIAIILEIGVLVVSILSGIGKYAEVIAIFSRVLAFLLVLGIYSQNKSPSIKMPWIILILIFPAVGISLYLMIGLSGSTARMRRRFEEVDRRLMPRLVQDPSVLEELGKKEPSVCGIGRYILNESGYPVYRNTKVRYYAEASDGLEAQKKALRKAKSFIFMEYFAIENARSWQGIEEILAEKVKEGVEVRVFYDDIGSIGYINTDFADRLKTLGIKCRIFNPVIPFFNLFLNNRDHRKMTIIDGETAFTGGYNIANEYFNITSPYGHWKDTGIRLEGDAVLAMTLTYLEMWNAVRADDEDDDSFQKYLKEPEKASSARGFVQYYADTPLDKKPIGEDVYLNMAGRAQKYVYYITPYLIITDELKRVLGLAAKRGVDVRIITPGVPDKKVIYMLSRSYYAGLAKDGVRIFEYSPGFCHAKMCVSDDVAATCGTINLDYRSLYHHFECGCLLVDNEAVAAIRDDFEEMFPQCAEVTEKYRSGRSVPLRLGMLILRLFAPLM